MLEEKKWYFMGTYNLTPVGESKLHEINPIMAASYRKSSTVESEAKNCRCVLLTEEEATFLSLHGCWFSLLSESDIESIDPLSVYSYRGY